MIAQTQLKGEERHKYNYIAISTYWKICYICSELIMKKMP